MPSVEQLPVDPLNDAAPGYTEDQRGKPNGFMGDPDVLDTWATSSLTPEIATKWFLDPQRHEKLLCILADCCEKVQGHIPFRKSWHQESEAFHTDREPDTRH